MKAAVGTIVDDQFEIVSTIGMGGYGVVYKAKQLNLERIVALKMLNASTDMDPDIRQRFEREAHALSCLKHRNLLMVYGSGFWRGQPYMSMEYVQGISLQRVLEEEGRMDVKRAIRIVRQVLDGLGCAHANGIVHRDLKPSNIMMLQRGEEELIKIIDFGLVKFLPEAGVTVQKVTAIGYAVGSVMYMSPEQCLAREVDHRSDIYAAGCILHSCLTGRHPYEGEHSAMVMMQHVQATPKMLSEYLSKDSFAPELQWVLNKALAKLPEERYSSVEEMSSDLLLIATDRSGEVSCPDAQVPQAQSIEEQPRRTFSPWCAALAGSLLTILAIVLFNSFFGTVVGESSSRLVRLGDAASAANDPVKALSLYEQALALSHRDHQLEPRTITDICGRLTVHYMAADPDKAIAYAQEGLHVNAEARRPISDSTLSIATYMLRAANNEFKPVDALPQCEKLLIKQDPMLRGCFEYHLRQAMAQSYVMMGRPAKALDMLNECKAGTDVWNDKNFVATDCYIRGEVAILQEQYEKAISEFEKTIRLGDRYLDAEAGIALAQVGLGQWDQAEKTLIHHRETFGATLNSKAVESVILAHNNNWAGAHSMLEQVCVLCEQNPDMFKSLGLEILLDRYINLAKAANNKRELDWSAEWFSRLHAVYLRHMHIFKQGNVHES